MSGAGTQNVGDARMEIDSRTQDDSQPGLEQGSYTIEKLRHASASHLHITNKRFFIGPIPKNWLLSHRKSWYKTRLRLRSYRSKTVTFSAESDFAREIEQPHVTHPPTEPEEDQPDAEQEADDGHEESPPMLDLRTLTHEYEEDDEPPPQVLTPDGETPGRRNDSRSAYFTAREPSPSLSSTARVPSAKRDKRPDWSLQAVSQSEQARNVSSHLNVSQPPPSAAPSESGSTAPLLRDSWNKDKGKQRSLASQVLQRQEPQRAISGEGDDVLRHRRQDTRFSQITHRLTLNDNFYSKKQRIASKVSRTQNKVPDWLSRRKIEEGEVIKAEKMLVRIEETIQEELPEDYTEFDSLRMKTRVQDNWREYLVVCRSTSDKKAPFTLQMYKTRVVPKIQEQNGKASPYHEILLGRKTSKMNLYSSLDKTIAVWNRSKRGTNIYIFRTKSAAHTVEWYTFIAYTLGKRRASSLVINVPDLAVSIIIKNPFKQLEAANPHRQKERDSISKSAGRSAYLSIIQGCMKMLENRPEWSAVMKEWTNAENMGLAWKRYDRLEWVHGANEEEMYGSLAMQGTHELELRPKKHYNTSVWYGPRKEKEPAPVEGFLIRLTSQKGVHQRMNRMFFKRLYFFCQDQYLFFCKPSQALPPTPPRLCAQDSDIPSTQEILDKTPLSYEIDPFSLQDGQISWMSNGNAEHLRRHDEDAYAQLQRNIHNLNNAEGFINLCLVQEIRRIPQDSPTPPDTNTQRNWDMESDDVPQDSNTTDQSIENAGFEILLDNGLVIRFQTYNSTTRNEWMKRLDSLVKYWKARTAADAVELKDNRQRNLELLGLNEELESVVGQYAKKWEVRKAEASPLLHNMCSLLGCRPIKMSGQLYKKPRRHGTFKRFHVVLASGKLLIYHSSLRKQNGVEIPHIHSNIESTIDLENCYIYSGLLTENDLLYSNQTFDSNNPGHGALPRVYLSSDMYTSSDEDTAITFVIWQPLRKGLFRARELGESGGTRQKLKSVSKLGVHGRTIVFKARSRVEKDRWVLSIASEIDRLQEGKMEEVRLTSS